MFRLCFVARTESSSNILFDWPCLLGAYCTTKIKCFRFSKSHTVCGVNVQWRQARAQRGPPACSHSPPPRAPIEIEKETVFIYMVISDVLRDLPFIRDEPLKSADD